LIATLGAAGFLLYLALAVFWVILEKRQPSATMAWLLVLIFMPFVGMLLYLYFGRQRRRRRIRLRTEGVARLAPGLDSAAGERDAEHPLDGVDDGHQPLLRLAHGLGYSPLVAGNRVELFFDGADKHEALFEAVRAAKQFVHLEYYILQPDETGLELRELLVERARAGVEVRLLVDGVGSLSLGEAFFRGLREAGARAERFHPIVLAPWRNRINYRNHRKIAVIDGDCGFIGGMNIGDEYRHGTEEAPAWRDTHLCVRGPAVQWLERVFVEDWHDQTSEILAEPRFFPDPAAQGDERVQILASGPEDELSAIHHIYFTAITSARERVRITTPYFVPDPPLLLALRTAALRGVEVELVLPGRTDLALVTWAGRSYFEELLEAGVRIHEYQPRILHAKVLTVDGHCATVGSANMDIRSFQLNYEVAAFVHGRQRVDELDRQFEIDLAQSSAVLLEDCERRPLRQRIAEATARVLSPML